jgi:hypothetical protein
MAKLYYPPIKDKDIPRDWWDYFRMWWRVLIYIGVIWVIASIIFTAVEYFNKELADIMSQIWFVSFSVAFVILFLGITIVHIVDVYIHRKRKHEGSNILNQSGLKKKDDADAAEIIISISSKGVKLRDVISLLDTASKLANSGMRGKHKVSK